MVKVSQVEKIVFEVRSIVLIHLHVNKVHLLIAISEIVNLKIINHDKHCGKMDKMGMAINVISNGKFRGEQNIQYEIPLSYCIIKNLLSQMAI